MPPHRNLERLVGAALVDAEFRALLLHSPSTAAADFELSEEELNVLDSAHTSTLEELAVHIHAWITEAPKPRSSTSPRWALDGYHTTRIAV